MKGSETLHLSIYIHEQDDTFVREGYDIDGKALERGSRGLGRIYQHNDASLMEKFGKAGISDIGG